MFVLVVRGIAAYVLYQVLLPYLPYVVGGAVLLAWGAAVSAALSIALVAGLWSNMAGDRGEPGDQTSSYTTNLMPIAGSLPDRRKRFNEFRDDFLLGYTHNTARAYWSDLEQIDWAEERGKDVLRLTEQDLKQYAALLRRRKYSESTIRRRVLVYRRFQQNF